MKSRFASIMSVASLVALLAPLPAAADVPEITSVVPFSFTVDGKTLPAGQYTVSTQAGALIIRGLHDGALVLGSPTGPEGEATTKLIFEKVAGTYALREVWMGGRSGRELPLSRKERDERKNARSGQVERVVVAGM